MASPARPPSCSCRPRAGSRRRPRSGSTRSRSCCAPSPRRPDVQLRKPPPPTRQDLHAMRAALEHAVPSRRELEALLGTLRTPSARGRLRAAAVTEIGRLRARLHAARAAVKRNTDRSHARHDLVALLTDVDGILALLAEL